MITQVIEAWPLKPQFLIKILWVIIFINYLPDFLHWNNKT